MLWAGTGWTSCVCVFLNLPCGDTSACEWESQGGPWARPRGRLLSTTSPLLASSLGAWPLAERPFLSSQGCSPTAPHVGAFPAPASALRGLCCAGGSQSCTLHSTRTYRYHSPPQRGKQAQREYAAYPRCQLVSEEVGEETKLWWAPEPVCSLLTTTQLSSLCWGGLPVGKR